ncbi:DUF721 domain-containing protein [Penaeicola halotolerans]|uniref:DUF721 domain-containing protein n=1 Tax=Penaeicola halotolerans TaxID=2793196 RepID=UPI001CF7F2EF|nr:DUF721 domain-containing protein [Penaeicola halotolerans]
MKNTPEQFKRKSNISPLKEAIDQLLKTYQIKDKFEEKSLISSWEKLMGTPIAKRTSSLYIKDKKLFVTLTSAPLKQEMMMTRHKVMEIIVQEFGKDVVEEIIFL